MQIDYQSSRFRVTNDGTTVYLHGALTDATGLNPVIEMAKPGLNFDCSQIQIASFAGVLNLFNALEQHAGSYQLINVPFFLYLTLVVIGAKPKVEISEQLICFKGPQNIELSMIKLNRALIALAWAHEGKTFVACQGPSEFPDTFQRSFTGDWSAENPEEASFWVDYIGFLFNTINQSEQNIGAAIVALNRYFSLLDIRIDTFSQAWEIMELPNRKGNWLGKKSIEKTTEMGAALLPTMTKLAELSKKVMSSVAIADCEKSESIKEAFDPLTEFKEIQKVNSGIIESHGAVIGDLLMSIESFKHVEKDLTQGLQNLPIEKLPEILEILGIMNPDAETDPKEAAQEIISEAKMAENDLNSCILILQAFDLVRQTLENRTLELDLLIENLDPYKRDEVHWTYIRDLIIDKFSSKFSTDQEKTTFTHYLNYLSKATDPSAADSSRSGDMLLF